MQNKDKTVDPKLRRGKYDYAKIKCAMMIKHYQRKVDPGTISAKGESAG